MIAIKWFLIGFIIGYIYRGVVSMINKWYYKNRKLFKKFKAEYKELNQDKRRTYHV